MKSHPYANNTPDEPAALLTSALVLALFGVLSAIGATGWIMTSTLFILAAAAWSVVWFSGTPRKIEVNA